jgi:cell division protein FtsB
MTLPAAKAFKESLTQKQAKLKQISLTNTSLNDTILSLNDTNILKGCRSSTTITDSPAAKIERRLNPSAYIFYHT